MKSRFFVTATLLVAASMSAMASDMKGYIEFPFKAMNVNMPSGQYEITRDSAGSSAKFFVRNAVSHAGIILIAHPVRPAKVDKPSATFRCVSSGCGLTEITTLDGYTYRVSQPKWNAAEKERLVTVYFDRVAAD